MSIEEMVNTNTINDDAITTSSVKTTINLFPHQIAAIQLMQKTENRPRMVSEQPHGGILAHAMGLGKTITMLSMVSRQGLGSTLVVCPKSVINQWRDEALRVMNISHDDIIIYHGTNRHAAICKSNMNHRLVLTTFDIVRLDHYNNNKPNPSCLTTEYWDRVILDEAHRICEQTSKTARAIRSLRARNRWCVTGTPFKNGVTDLVALSKFLHIPPYCNSTWWRCHSQNRHKIREWRNTFLIMQDKAVLQLAPLNDMTVKVTRNTIEQSVVDAMHSAQFMSVPGESRNITALTEQEAADLRACGGIPQQEHELLKILRLRQIANHPLMLVSSDIMLQLVRYGIFSDNDNNNRCNACGISIQTVPTRKKMRVMDCSHRLCGSCREDIVMCPCCITEALPISTGITGKKWRHSAKTEALWNYLSTTFNSSPNDKIVLFSQWTTCLDLFACMLDVMGYKYARFDGRVNGTDERGDIITQFRDERECRVLLTSLGAGGEGLNLTFANHVILMEPYWNCAMEQQAIDRLHRIGQTRVTNVVRFVMHDSIEDWVQEIQTKKTKELQRLLCGKEIINTTTATSTQYIQRPAGNMNGNGGGGGSSNNKVSVNDVTITTAKARFNEPFNMSITIKEKGKVGGGGRDCKTTCEGLMRFLSNWGV